MQYTKDDRIKALLCYIWPVGLVLFFIEKNNAFVRFNAAQAVVLLALGIIMRLLDFIPVSLFSFIYWLFSVAILIVSVIAAINCWNGNTFRIPVVSDLADWLIAKVP